MSRCLDAGWRSPKPRCTCGAGYDAPGTAHYSVRFPYSTTRELKLAREVDPDTSVADLQGMLPATPMYLWPKQDLTKDCSVYLWERGCDVADHDPASYACPVKTCGKVFTYCRAHGGAARAQTECHQHVIDHTVQS